MRSLSRHFVVFGIASKIQDSKDSCVSAFMEAAVREKNFYCCETLNGQADCLFFIQL